MLIVVMMRRINNFTIINLSHIAPIGISLNLLKYKVTYNCFIDFVYRLSHEHVRHYIILIDDRDMRLKYMSMTEQETMEQNSMHCETL